MMEKESRLRHMVLTGLFAALICLTTAFILHIPVGNGYIHLGDSFIYLAACVLPMPYGIIAAALGGSMADLLSGYAIYALPHRNHQVHAGLLLLRHGSAEDPDPA